VDGRRAVRARTPNVGAEPPSLKLADANLSADLKTYTYSFPPGVLQNWRNLSDVEAVVVGEWELTRKLFQSVDPNSGTAQMVGPHWQPHPNIAAGKGRQFYIENAFEALDEPGEFYLDRATGVLTYWPRPGEDLAKAEVIAPRLTRLLEIAGTAEKSVRNLHFKGIAFAYTDWAIPRGGYLGIQSCHYSTGNGTDKSTHGTIEPAVRFDYAESCGLEDCALVHLGGCGVELLTRCQGNVLQGNLIHDVSGNGVMLGGPEEESNVPKGNRIANNLIHSCGLDYFGAVGIWVGLSQKTVISHNELHDLPYTGISMGWEWSTKPTAARQNTIECNHVHAVMCRLADGGAIYTLGLQPDSIIRGNHLHDVRRSPLAQGYPTNGMFCDEGTSGFTIENNLVHDTNGTSLRFHKATADVVRDNILMAGKAGPVEYNFTDPNNIKLQDNKLVEAGKEIPANDIAPKAGLEEPYRAKLASTQPAKP
jgi:hypothetical protein